MSLTNAPQNPLSIAALTIVSFAVRGTRASASALSTSAPHAQTSSASHTRRAASNGKRASIDHNGSESAGPTNGKSSSRAASTPGIVRSTAHTSRDHGSPPRFQLAPAA